MQFYEIRTMKFPNGAKNQVSLKINLFLLF